jgi:hypothetical protein
MRRMDLDAIQARLTTMLKDPDMFRTELIRRIAERLADPANIHVLESLVTNEQRLSHTYTPPELHGRTVL